MTNSRRLTSQLACASVVVFGLAVAAGSHGPACVIVAKGDEHPVAAATATSAAVTSATETSATETSANHTTAAETADHGEVPVVGSRFRASDSLLCDIDASSDAQSCLAGLRWQPGEFEVHCEEAARQRGDLLVRFPSPRPGGDAVNDLVAMEWYMARDKQQHPVRAPAVVVVHESGSSMTVGRVFARGMWARGYHAFLVQLPGYGVRRTAAGNDVKNLLPGMKQGIADVRRARDAVAALPFVDSSLIALQGTSLGGFVVATASGMDTAYQRTFIMLAGGDLRKVVLSGNKDAAKVRERLLAAGLTNQEISDLAHPIEPLRLAHRMQSDSTWLFCARNDDVVPPECSVALAKAADLPDAHFVVMEADHYSGVLYLPVMINQMQLLMQTSGPAVPAIEVR